MEHSCPHRSLVQYSHTHTQTHSWYDKKQNGSQKYLYSWRVTDPSSAIDKETEDEEGQVEPGTFGTPVCSWMCLMYKRTLNLFRRRILLITSLHRDTWLWNTERNQLGPGKLDNAVNIVRGESTYSLRGHAAETSVNLRKVVIVSLKILRISCSHYLHGECFKFVLICILRCGSRPVGHGGGMLTSGEESSAEWRWDQLDTDEEQRSEEWLVRSEELQMNPQWPSTTLHLLLWSDNIYWVFIGAAFCLFSSECLLFMSFSVKPLSKWCKRPKFILFCFRKRGCTWFWTLSKSLCVSKSLSRSPSACTDTCLLSAYLHDCLVPLCLD